MEARGLSKTFGTGDVAVRALDRVDLTLERGTFTALMGPSGSGKSTLLHCLAALDLPDDGEIRLGSTAITGLSDSDLTAIRRDRFGFIFQSFNLVPTLSALENITLPAALAGRDHDATRLRSLATRLRIADRLDHRPGELSGGQRQRVAIARALLGSPDIVFADEPTGSLDSVSSEQVLRLLRECADVDGQTILMVTHDESAAAVADRIVRMRDGRIAS
jgi:putative ABC transport system ATP-binding protein